MSSFCEFFFLFWSNLAYNMFYAGLESFPEADNKKEVFPSQFSLLFELSYQLIISS